MKAEGGRMKQELRKRLLPRALSFILHPSSFIL